MKPRKAKTSYVERNTLSNEVAELARKCAPLLAYFYVGEDKSRLRVRDAIRRLVEEWRCSPIEPKGAAKAVTKYLDNLIEWGDSLFLEETTESIGEATKVYMFAEDVLGPCPPQVSHVDSKTNPWARVTDRLAKIRDCRNIYGDKCILQLFDPPIDPALLVRCKEAGLDLTSLLPRKVK